MPKFAEKAERIVNKIADIQQVVANIALFFIMALVTFDVIGREFLNKPIKGAYEVTELIAALLVFFALAVTHRYGGHISIDFLIERFPKRVKQVVDGIIEIVISIILFAMARHIFANGMRMMERNATTTE